MMAAMPKNRHLTYSDQQAQSARLKKLEQSAPVATQQNPAPAQQSAEQVKPPRQEAKPQSKPETKPAAKQTAKPAAKKSKKN